MSGHLHVLFRQQIEWQTGVTIERRTSDIITTTAPRGFPARNGFLSTRTLFQMRSQCPGSFGWRNSVVPPTRPAHDRDRKPVSLFQSATASSPAARAVKDRANRPKNYSAI